MWWRKNLSKVCAGLLVAGGLAGLAGCNKLRSRDLLNKGAQAYKEAKFDEAEADFRQAAQLDPSFLDARIYLAASYASQYVQGSTAPENIQKAQEAIAEYKKVLDRDPNNLNAIDSIGSMLYNLGGVPFNAQTLEQAKSWEEKHIAIKPDDAQPYYWIGLLDWTLAWHANGIMRTDYNDHLPKRKRAIQTTDPLPEKLRTDFAAKYEQTADEGIQALQKAMELKSNYSDAMSYLNLLYRQKADMVASSDERASLLKQADDLMMKANQIKQQQNASPPPGAS